MATTSCRSKSPAPSSRSDARAPPSGTARDRGRTVRHSPAGAKDRLGLSALMAALFAVVVILGKQVSAGELPFVTLAIRFGGQSILLFGLAECSTRRPGRPRQGSGVASIAGTIGYGSEAALPTSPGLNHAAWAAAVTLLVTGSGVGDARDDRPRPRRPPRDAVRRARTWRSREKRDGRPAGGGAEITSLGLCSPARRVVRIPPTSSVPTGT